MSNLQSQPLQNVSSSSQNLAQNSVTSVNCGEGLNSVTVGNQAQFNAVHPLPFSPQNLSVSLKLWLSARARYSTWDQGGMVANAVPVDTWNSIVGAGSFTQSTTSEQPTFRSNACNGLPGISFDGVAGQLAGNTAACQISQNVSGLTIVMAMRFRSYNTNQGAGIQNNVVTINTGSPNYNSRLTYQAYCYDGLNANRQIAAQALDGDAYSSIDTTSINQAPLNTWSIETCQVNFATAQGRIRINGLTRLDWSAFTSMTSGNTSNTAAGSFTIGADWNNSHYSLLDVGEILIFPGILPDNELFALEDQLKHIWTPPPVVGAMVFNDEFNEAALDTTKWNTLYPWGSRTNAANGELEYMLDANVTVSNGACSLTAESQTVVEGGTTYNYTSGMITSYGKFSFIYGDIEVRAKLASGQGFNSAFWFLWADPSFGWPPELDLYEMLGNATTSFYCTCHYENTAAEQLQTQVTTNVDTSAGFHLYRMHWEPGLIIFFFDGQEVARYTYGVPNVKLYMLADLSVGGTWQGNPNGGTPFPSSHMIDFVRVWALPSQSVPTASLNFNNAANSGYVSWL